MTKWLVDEEEDKIDVYSVSVNGLKRRYEYRETKRKMRCLLFISEWSKKTIRIQRDEEDRGCNTHEQSKHKHITLNSNTRTKHTPRCHKENTKKTHENLAQGSRHNHRRCQSHRHRRRSKGDESPKETRAIVSDVTRDTTRATHLRFWATQSEQTMHKQITLNSNTHRLSTHHAKRPQRNHE